MVKTRVHDLAAEFGVAPEQLLGILKEMNIFVRSHLSALEHDQVSAVRVRWEREKRKSADEPSAKKGRRRAVKAEPAPAPVEAKPSKRRRTAAEVAQVEAQAQAEKAAELAALELERPVLHELEESAPTQTLEERARALFKDLPPSPVETEEESPPRARISRVLAFFVPEHDTGADTRALHSTVAFSVPRLPLPAVRSRSSAAARHPRRRAVRPPEPSRRPAAHGNARSQHAGAHLRARRREGWRPQEGEEGQALDGRSGCRAGKHPEDAAGHEGPGRPEGCAPLG